ncbi:MAG: thioesterase family protein [Rhizobiaceae bacterium]
MIMYSRELTVNWGESDPFGLVYFPLMLAWFNDTEHDLLRAVGFPTNRMIAESRTAFVMGDVHFKFIGPAAYGDRVRTIIQLVKMTKSTLHWDCKAVHSSSGDLITLGRAIRIHAQIQNDGNIKSVPIPDEIRDALSKPGALVDMKAGHPESD